VSEARGVLQGGGPTQLYRRSASILQDIDTAGNGCPKQRGPRTATLHGAGYPLPVTGPTGEQIGVADLGIVESSMDQLIRRIAQLEAQPTANQGPQRGYQHGTPNRGRGGRGQDGYGARGFDGYGGRGGGGRAGYGRGRGGYWGGADEEPSPKNGEGLLPTQ
jgi:hypothetical protein